MTPTKFQNLIRKTKCLLGLHAWETPVITCYGQDVFWQQGGKECKHCKKFLISKSDLSKSIEYAAYRAKDAENTRMIAYAKGLPEILKHYPDSPLKYGFIRDPRCKVN